MRPTLTLTPAEEEALIEFVGDDALPAGYFCYSVEIHRRSDQNLIKVELLFFPDHLLAFVRSYGRPTALVCGKNVEEVIDDYTHQRILKEIPNELDMPPALSLSA